jgi:long-chain fatty acid transport protein
MRPLVIIIALLSCSLDTYAAGKINRYSGLSAEYARSLNRYAATELDAAYYNPAGLVFGREGFGLKVLNQSTFLKSRFTITDAEALEQTGHDGELQYTPEVVSYNVVIPSPMLMASYNTGDLAFHLTTGILAGGVIELEGNHPVLLESANYVLGSINNRVQEESGAQDFYSGVDFYDSTLSAGTYYGGLMMGGSYKVYDWLSVSLTGKFIYAWGKIGLKTDFQVYHVDLGWGDVLDGTDMIQVEADQTGYGFSGLASVHVRPLDGLDIAFKYETLTKIEMTTTPTVDTAGIITREPTRSDMPAQFTAGVNYSILPELSVQLSFAWFFNSQAQIGELLGYDPSSELKDGWETGVSFEYQVNQDLLLSAGYLHLNTGYRQETRASNRFSMPGHFIGLGGAYQASEDMRLVVGLMAMLDEPGMNRGNNIELQVDAYILSIGLDYWFL